MVISRYLLYIILWLCCSCKVSRQVSEKKYPISQLREDYSIFKGALEESHPGLYWFTPEAEMNDFFKEGLQALTDSMTEREFKTVLTKVATAIKCGHTSVAYSKKYLKYLDTARLKLFPLAFKVFPDTLVVTVNLNAKDSLLKRGTIVTAINNYPAAALIDTFLQYTVGDGNAITGKYQSLSSFGMFGSMYKNLFGISDTFSIQYIDTNGQVAFTNIPAFKSSIDEVKKKDSIKREKRSPKERKKYPAFSPKNIQIDTTLKSAYMMVNSFARGNQLKRFFRYSFKNIDRLNIEHLVIDVRSNGGGEAGNAIALTQYLSDKPFIVADSLYAIKRSSQYRDHIKMQPAYWLASLFITKKREDGKFHFGYFERHVFKPRKKYHYDKNIYILTGGNSFSATTLFAQQLKGQQNVKIIGEETGGGAYGNSAWIISELKLPNTHLRINIPRFRFVMNKDLAEAGRGVLPDLYIAPRPRDILKGTDVKLQAVKFLVLMANGY